MLAVIKIPQIIFIFCLLISQLCYAHNFEPFAKILNSHLIVKDLVCGGFESSFNYTKAFNEKKTSLLLKQQKELLQKYDITSLKSKNEANAFWINTYNFFMISTILESGFKDSKLNINSVKDFGSFFSPYKIFQQQGYQVGKKKYSLDEIEKKILLGEDYKKSGWKDARIHFAVNCASVGCPPLIKTIYTDDNIDSLLNDNIKKALKTHRHFHFKDNILKLTHLFKWYKKDFEEHSGSIENFLEQFINDPTLTKKIHETKEINYIEYDWKLNRPENFKSH